MSNDSLSNKRIAKNTLFLYLRMFLVLIVSLYTSRVVLNVLGVSDYGVYNVVAGFVTLFGFLNATLSSSMQRFYNFEGGKRGNIGLADVYSIGFWIHIILAIIVFITLESFGIWYINNVMVIDINRLEAANYLFHYTTISLLFLIIQIPYLSIILSKEKMDFYAKVSIIDIVLRLLTVLALPHVPCDKLRMYGIFMSIISVVDFLVYYIYVKKNFSFLKLRRVQNKSIFKNLLSFSGWNLIGTFAFVLKGQGLNLLLNVFFDTTINAARGIAFQINNAIGGFTNNASMAFKPQIVHSFAIGDMQTTRKLMFVESKICYVLILVLIVPVIIEIDYLLALWLGDSVPPFTSVFSILVLIDLLVSTLNAPVTQVAFATGKIRWYQIFSSIINLLLLPSSYLLLSAGCQPFIVFVVTILFTIFNQVVCLITLHAVFDYSYLDYLKKILLPCFVITLTLPIIPFILKEYMPDSFLRLMTILCCVVILAIPMTYQIVLDQKEKGILRQFVVNILKKIK